MIKRYLGILLSLLALIGTSALAADQTDKVAILERLEGWAAAFNARDAVGVCDLFTPNLVSTVPDAIEVGRDVVCERLAKLLANSQLSLHYDLDVREIIISGDIAVVRLFWTLTTRDGTVLTVDTEAGMDVFERQADGVWSIARFLAFTMTANESPQ